MLLRYFSIFIFLTLLTYLYDKYKLKFEPDEELKKYNLVQKFLLNKSGMFGNKPILWIHTTHNINQRWWPSFGSRNTSLLNQPYIISCVETIIKHCSDSFNICLIDDNSFEKIIPHWNIEMNKLSEPIKCHMRLLALSKLLYNYGGLLLPNSTIVCKDLKEIYNKSISEKGCFSVNMINRSSSSDYNSIFPSTKIMGCSKNNETMKEFVNHLEILSGTDYTNESDFLGQANNWLYKKYKENKIKILCAKLFGIEDSNGDIVNVDRLMGEGHIQFIKNKVAIYIPQDEIARRTKYQWFARLSREQLINCDSIVAKYLLIS